MAHRTRAVLTAALGVVVSVTLLGAAGSPQFAAAAAGAPVRVSGPTPFPVDCGDAAAPGDDTLYRDAEVQPHLAADPGDPRHLVGVYQQDRWAEVASQGVLTVASFDGGRSWTRTAPPVSVCSGGTAANGGDFARVTDSRTTIGPDGTAYLMALSLTGGLLEPGSDAALLVLRSTDGGRSWGPATTLIRESGEQGFNDLPTIVADPRDPRLVYAAWTRYALLGGTDFVAPTYLSRSTDGGRTWETPRSIFDPGTNNYSYVDQILVRPDGGLVLSQATYTTDPATGVPSGDAVVLHSADRGRTWSAPVTVADLRTVGTTDPDTGTPVRNGSDFVHSAIDGRGTLYLAWQDGRFSGGARDAIALSRSTDGGSTWSEPVPVNGDLSVPAFQPAVAATRDGRVAVGYHDFGQNTPDPRTLPTRYRVATSPDGESRWTQRPVGAPFDLALAPRSSRPVEALYVGDRHGLVAAGSTFVPLFPVTTRDPRNRTEIVAAIVRPRG